MLGRLTSPQHRIVRALMRTILPLLVVTLALATVLTIATMLTLDSGTPSAAPASPGATSTLLDDPGDCYHWVGQPCTIHPHP